MNLDQPSPSVPCQAAAATIRGETWRVPTVTAAALRENAVTMAVDNSILDTARHEPRPGTIRVCLLAWGATEADQEHAIRRAGQGWGRNGWEFVGTERLIGNVCPLDVRDGRSIAADAGYGWAYIVYAAAACS